MFGRMSTDPDIICGPVVMEPHQLSFIGWYEDGSATGWAWRGLVGGAWLGGEVDKEGTFTGEGLTYVYPDILTALQGKFENGFMVRRHFSLSN